MYLYSDAVDYLLDTVGGGAADSEHRVIRQAIGHAYRDLITARDWRWFETHDVLDIDRDYIVHTLPWGTQSVDSFLFTETGSIDLMGRYVHPRDFQRAFDYWDRNEFPRTIWTIQKSDTAPDRYDLRILTEAGLIGNTATLTYRRRPRDLRLSGYEPRSRVGRVDVAGVTFTGDSTTKFVPQMIGAVIRVSDDDKNAPESLNGITPYVDEAVIYNVTDNQTLYAWSPTGGMNFTNTRYIVSDVLDISPGMMTALLSGAEAWSSRLLGKNVEGAYALYGRDLRLAFESDAVAVLTGREHLCGCGCPFWWIRPGSDMGTGGPGSGGPNQEGPCPLRPDVDGGDADSEINQEWTGNVFGGTASSTFNDCGEPS